MTGRANVGWARWLPLGAVLSLLVACGGGSSSPDSGNDAAAGSQARPAAIGNELLSADAAGKDASFEPQGEFARETLKAINDARAQPRTCGATAYPAVAPLRWSLKATEAARIESDWMQATNSWGHVWPDGTNVATRLDRAGYEWQSAGENIAAGFLSLESVMIAWLESPGHCANIMRADVDEVGVSLIWGESRNTYRSYWTMVLAKPVSD